MKNNRLYYFTIIVIIIFLLALMVACTESRKEINASLEEYSFDESVEISDLIAEIEIIEKVSEIDEPSPKTLFNAKIIKVFKGELNSNKDNSIVVMQQGNSEWIFNNNKLFEAGEKYVLFLKKATGYDNTYWILCEEINTYTIETIDNAKYIVKNSVKDARLKKIQVDEKETIGKITNRLKGKMIKQEKIKDIQVMKKDMFDAELTATINEKEEGSVNE